MFGLLEELDGLSLLVHDERKDICGLVWGTARSGACNGLEFGGKLQIDDMQRVRVSVGKVLVQG